MVSIKKFIAQKLLVVPNFHFLAATVGGNVLGCPGEERRGLIAGVSIREVWPHLVQSRRRFQF